MRKCRALTFLCIAFALSTLTEATRTGDEDFGAETSGVFYTFADRIVQVISPFNLTVTKNITTDEAGKPLTNEGATSKPSGSNISRTWNDAAFVQDASQGLRYVVVNEGDVYTNGSEEYSYVSVIDARTQEFAARLTVGPRPVHLYSINQTNAIWTHSDEEGIFYIIPLNNSANISVSKTVPGYVDNPGHGKLVINNYLYPIGYGSNVNEPILPKYNLSSETRIGNITYNTSLPDPSICTGTHTIVYSDVNKHLFIECVDATGILEWNTVNDTLVRLHREVNGVVTGAPADDVIIVGNNEYSNATLLRPGRNGEASTVLATLSVPYNPAYPAFYSNSSDELNPETFTEYTLYFPLTRNTNLNNIRAAGTNVTTAAYAVAPSDCDYSRNGTVAAASVDSDATSEGLTLAKAANGSSITPTCGACAAGISNGNASQFNASLSGFGEIDLAIFREAGTTNATTNLISAGATLPSQNLETGANECSFSPENYRTIRRGGPFIATVADLPRPSVYFLEATSNSVYGSVATAQKPSKLVWTPASVD